tara:strand:- start:1156 stop:1524 length:369 start_codon:yes stop_codon:yes gene_type:complete
MTRFTNLLPIILIILLTVTSQLTLKWRIDNLIKKSDDVSDQIQLIFKNIFDPYIILCFTLAFIAAVSWIFTLTRFNLSSAYPYMALNFLLVIILSSIFLGEVLSTRNIVAAILIVIGVALLT